MPAAWRGVQRPSARVGTLVCHAQPKLEESGCRSDPAAALSSSKPWARGTASHLHVTGSTPSLGLGFSVTFS